MPIGEIAMAITVLCPGCSTRLTVDDERAGETVDCPRCDLTMSIPYPGKPVPPSSSGSSLPPPPTKFCHECGATIRKKAEICPECGVRQPGLPRRRDPALRHASSQKLAAGLCGIFLGCFGIHKFILGMNKQGLLLLLVTVLSCGLAYFVTHAIGLIEGIIYLTKSDEDFYELYVIEKKEWF